MAREEKIHPEKSIFDWFKEIKNLERATLVTIITTGTIALCAFIYNNFSFPKDEKRIDDIQNYISTDRTEKALIKNDILHMQIGFDEFRKQMKNEFDRLNDKMDENNRIIKVVNQNTK